MKTKIKGKKPEVPCSGHRCVDCKKELYTHTLMDGLITFIIMSVIMVGMLTFMVWITPEDTGTTCYKKALLSTTGGTELWSTSDVECPIK